MPYVRARVSGNVGEAQHEVERTGFADLRLKLAVNLIGGYGFGETKVRLSKPIEFETTAEFTGGNLGLGATGAFGFRRTFVVADYSHQWAYSSLLDAPVPADIFSARLGRSFRVGEKSRRVRGTWATTSPA